MKRRCSAHAVLRNGSRALTVGGLGKTARILSMARFAKLYIDDIKARADRTGSNVNQEVVQMAAASTVEILRPQVVKDAVAEAVFILAKRQKYTLTRLPDIGQRILNESVPDSPWFEANLAGFDEQAANTFLGSPLGQSGLRGAEVRIDCTIIDGPRSPAHVIMYAEAKFKLQSTSERDEAVGQIWQRVDQLASDQDMRETWTVAIISHNSLQLWQFRQNQNRCKHTALLPFSLSANSAGFQMICRWLISDPQALGYLPPHLPTIHIGNEVMRPAAKTLMTLAQAVETGFTTGTPLFMGWNVIRKKGHLVSTELESLFYVFTFVVASGILPWRHTPFEDHNLAATVFDIMASDEFSARDLKRVPGVCHDMLDRLRRLFFSPDYATDVTPERFISELHL
ncbi:hypothetical protein WJX77_002314 [Trebouxia sp. C0004]